MFMVYCIHYILTNFGRCCCRLQGGYYYKNRKSVVSCVVATPQQLNIIITSVQII